ncbi:diguanylate cyclase [Pseudoxanthomonas gei]|uniref:Diguanylate cyclase n=1 Tax=Pseudoxanthomonas gei TaxID=1383030 RepID=A0ABX0A8M8_9GAMM|nr:diguanylate cyclase [Pseudoxanthomonas gei]NDK37880.1 diguanylate cyclase [Pseudoxanthomonas gei]
MTPTVSPCAPVSPESGHAAATELARLRAELEVVRSELRDCQESHERNHASLCAIADGIAIVDTQGLVTCLNPVASHLIGCKEDACLGRPLAKVVQFIDHQGCSVNVLAEGFSSDPDAIVSLVRRDGHVILVDGAVSPVHARDKRALGTVVTFRNVTAATKLARELSYHANHDTMTGLHNRRAFEAQLQRAIINASEFGSRNALLYLDLDQFKAVNDSGGHLAGDELLRQLAVLLRKQLREHDTVARLGGDEFAVLVENSTSADAALVAEKIRNAVVDFAFSWDGGEFRIGTSIGLVEFSDGERHVEELIELADSMCYVAKDRGRNCVAIHDAAGTRTVTAGQDVSHRPGARREENAILRSG